MGYCCSSEARASRVREVLLLALLKAKGAGAGLGEEQDVWARQSFALVVASWL
jgi:hypothetical protein